MYRWVRGLFWVFTLITLFYKVAFLVDFLVEVCVLGLFLCKFTLLTPFLMLWFEPKFAVNRNVRRCSPLEWTFHTNVWKLSCPHEDLVEFRVRPFSRPPQFLFFVVTLVTLAAKMWAFLQASVYHHVWPSFLKETVITRVSKPAFLVDWAVYFFSVLVLEDFQFCLGHLKELGKWTLHRHGYFLLEEGHYRNGRSLDNSFGKCLWNVNLEMLWGKVRYVSSPRRVVY